MFDKVAMYLGGGLILFGAVVIGLVETFSGAPTPSPARDRSFTRRSSC